MMNKKFKTYALVWIIFVVLFHGACFIMPNEIAGLTKPYRNFTTGIVFIDLAFIGQLICAYLGLKEENIKKHFYNISLIAISYTGLIIILAAGTITMIIPNLPNWIGILICMLAFAFTTVSIIKTKAAADIAEQVDRKIQTKTLFIKSLTIDAEQLMSSAKSDAAKKETKRVYEKIRYSDPMSDDALADIESQITSKFTDFCNAVNANDNGAATLSANELILLIEDRNKKCRLLK